MKRFLLFIALLFIAGWLTGYVLFGKPSLQQRALAAYKDGDYQKALPLFKQYGETAAVRNNAEEKKVVVAYIFDIQMKLRAQAAAANPVIAATNPAATAVATAPGASNDLMAQALSYALQQNGPNPNDPPMTAADRIPHTRPKPGDVLTMSIKELGNFEFDPMVDAEVPKDVYLMEGARVRLNGFMIPLTQAVKVTDFALVPSLVGCCFGQPPGVQHVVTCKTADGKGLDYVMDEMVVEGVVHVHVKREDGYTSSIFELDVTNASVKE
jgi:hypothetical protein